jgi:hypothetical protein
MDFQLKKMSEISKDSIIKDIIRVDKIVNEKILTKEKYCKHSRVSQNTVLKYFRTWHNALVSAGLSHKSNNRIPTIKLQNQKAKYLNDDEIITELKNVAKMLNSRTITVSELDENSEIISASTIRNRFGWKKGLKLAGLEIAPLGKRYSDNECFDNLLNVWTFYKRQPKASEINKEPSEVGLKAYIRRWGSWIKALEAFVSKINSTSIQEDVLISIFSNSKQNNHKEVKVKVEDPRDIGIGLRYKVLSRDNFKCIKCGNSPFSDPKCILHVDHKIPVSKGGNKKIENLQTLCNKCNIGKSNNL